MTKSRIDAARPGRRSGSRRPPETVEPSLFHWLDRFGLAPVLLLGLAYVVHTQVVAPIAGAYVRMVEAVGDTNRLIRESIEEKNAEGIARVALLKEAQEANRRVAEENRELNTRILERLEELKSLHVGGNHR